MRAIIASSISFYITWQRYWPGDTQVYAIGKIGDDTNGGRLVREMREAGIGTEFVQQAKSGVTMYSVPAIS